MSMEINGNYNHVKTDYAERLKEEQQIDKTKKAEEKESDKASAPQDEYISSEKSGEKPSGLYRLERDENGNRKIVLTIRRKRGI